MKRSVRTVISGAGFIAVVWYVALDPGRPAPTAEISAAREHLEPSPFAEAPEPTPTVSGPQVTAPESLRGSPSEGETADSDPAEDEAERLPEDEAMRASDLTWQQQRWRRIYQAEPEDTEWTQRMQDSLTAAAEELVDGKLEIENLSCRQTICRMYVELEHEADIEPLLSRAIGAETAHQAQPLEGLESEGSEPSTFTYEVLVDRSSDSAHASVQVPIPTQLVLHSTSRGELEGP